MEEKMKTHVAKTGETEPRWYIVDAEGEILGRLASRVAQVIRGKHRPDFTPHVLHGDHVIVVNAGKIKVSGRKREQKNYTRYSGYQSGLKRKVLGELLTENPEQVISHAVRGMLPKSRLGRKMHRCLRVYADANHPHTAQKPEILEV
jgi:large subunit ribosomal protein L13